MERCDADHRERATTTWLNLARDLILTLCAHHSRQHGHALIVAGFMPVADREPAHF